MTTSMRTAATITLVKAIGIAAGLIVAFAVIGADETAPVPKPDVKVGDSWTYRVTSHRTNVPQVLTFKGNVSYADGNLITLVSIDDKGQERDSQFTAEWNAISLGTGQVFKEPQLFFRFPMRPGDAHPFIFEVVAMRGSSDRWRSEGGTKVVRWEEIVVPAGKFRALKLEVNNTFRLLTSNASGWARREIWYVPEIKRWVKWNSQEGDHGKSWPNFKTEIELIDHAVK